MFMQRAKGSRRQKGRSRDVSIPQTFEELIAPALREKMHIICINIAKGTTDPRVEFILPK